MRNELSNKKQTLWGSGVGVDPEVWFKKPRIYILINREGEKYYAPLRDYSSCPFRGGFWIGKIGLSISSECVTFISPNKREVELFIECARKYCERINARSALIFIKTELSDALRREKKLQ